MTTYALYKLIHLIAVILFLGNATLGLFWVAHAKRSRDPAIIRHAMLGIIRADRWFTTPGVVLIVAGGVAAAISGHLRLLATGWILGSIVMFTISGVVFGAFLAPLQRRIVIEIERSPDAVVERSPLLQRWHRLGWLALAPLWIAVAMMVTKWPG